MESQREKVVSIQEAIMQNLELRARKKDFQGFFEIVRDSQRLTKVHLKDVGGHFDINMATVYRWSKGKNFPRSHTYQQLIMQNVMELLKAKNGSKK